MVNDKTAGDRRFSVSCGDVRSSVSICVYPGYICAGDCDRYALLIRKLRVPENRVFSLEFKMKDRIEPDEVLQAAKYVPYLEILFGRGKDIYPALVLTGTSELFTYEPIGETEYVLPVCSGDMLFNVFNETMGFLG